MIGAPLRLRMDLQRRVDTRSDDGDTIIVWETRERGIPASIEYVRARELIAAQSAKSEITGTITIRYRPDIATSDRFVFDGKFFDVAGVFPDPTNRHFMKVVFRQGVSDGRR